MATAQSNLDFQSVYQLLNARFQLVSSDPGSPADGQFWINTTSWQLKVRLDGTTVTLATLSDIAGAGGGDMVAATYDPQGIADDAFDASNLTGLSAVVAALSLDADTLGGSNLATILANARDRSTHTGTQLSATISDLDTAIRAVIETDLDPAGAAETLDTISELAATAQALLAADDSLLLTINAKSDVQSALIGDASATTFSVPHGADSSEDVTGVTLRSFTGEEIAIWDRVVNDTNIVVTIVPAPAVDEYRVLWTA